MSQKVTVHSYTLKRSRRRTIAVEVHPTGELVVRSPLRFPQREIDAFLSDRAAWIEARLAQVAAINESLPPLTRPNSFYHRGLERFWEGAPQARDVWERKQAHEVFTGMIHAMLPALSLGALRFQSLRLRVMRRRWGSCSASGHITLNTRLIRVPDACSQAVIAHELAHLVHMNHGAEFRSLARQILPNYDLANAELDRWTVVLSS